MRTDEQLSSPWGTVVFILRTRCLNLEEQSSSFWGRTVKTVIFIMRKNSENSHFYLKEEQWEQMNSCLYFEEEQSSSSLGQWEQMNSHLILRNSCLHLEEEQWEQSSSSKGRKMRTDEKWEQSSSSKGRKMRTHEQSSSFWGRTVNTVIFILRKHSEKSHFHLKE